MYASPRFSRISWKSLLDIPPPSTEFIMPKAKRRGSPATKPRVPSSRLICSLGRSTFTSFGASSGTAAAAVARPRRSGAREVPVCHRSSCEALSASNTSSTRRS
ncbi:hypothetical protein ACI1US_00097 [Leucobacter sp. BZR 635]